MSVNCRALRNDEATLSYACKGSAKGLNKIFESSSIVELFNPEDELGFGAFLVGERVDSFQLNIKFKGRDFSGTWFS